MFKKLSLIFIITSFLTGCGWHFKNVKQLPESLQKIALVTNDPYAGMARALRNELLLNNIELVPQQDGVVTLYLHSTSSSDRVASVFKHALEAEKILSLTVTTNLKIPNKGVYPIDVVLHRTFFDDSRVALSKSTEQDAIATEMYRQASSRIIIKMIALEKLLSKKD